MKKERRFPKYVWMLGKSSRTALELKAGTCTYYRVAGEWRINARWVGDKLLTFGVKGVRGLGDRELVACTRKSWERDNDGYLPHYEGGRIPEEKKK